VNAQDFLFEIRTEEIPAPALLAARLDLARGLSDALAEEGLTPASVESYATPRRLAVVLRGLPERQEDRFAEVLGPPESSAFGKDGKPTKAAEGFAKAQKVESRAVVVDSRAAAPWRPAGRSPAAARLRCWRGLRGCPR
jgi:glycyl-tRNA synthetase beta chain